MVFQLSASTVGLSVSGARVRLCDWQINVVLVARKAGNPIRVQGLP